jgi:hypothetical protein
MTDRGRNFWSEHPFVQIDHMRTGFRKPTSQRPAARVQRRRRDEGPAQAHERSIAEPEPQDRSRRLNGPENRELRSGGPQDKALYICRCGSAFHAGVSASVRCPHCGDSQAW